MSKLKIYAVKDVKVGNYSSTPFMLDNDDVAVRAFKTAINSNNGSQVSEYYEDMQLWRLGEFDDKTGVITSEVEFIANGPDVKVFAKETKKEEESAECNSEAN